MTICWVMFALAGNGTVSELMNLGFDLAILCILNL